MLLSQFLQIDRFSSFHEWTFEDRWFPLIDLLYEPTHSADSILYLTLSYLAQYFCPFD